MKGKVNKERKRDEECAENLISKNDAMLIEGIIVAKLDMVYETLKAKKAEDEEDHENRLKECKSTSVMTKYQMIFTKIEIYMSRLVSLFYCREQRLKLVAFLRIKTKSKLRPAFTDSFFKLILYSLVRGFNSLEAVSRRLETKLKVKGFIFLKYTSEHLSTEQAILNSSNNARLGLLKMFKKNNSKRYIINRFDDCLKDSEAELKTSEKLVQSKLSSTVS